MKYSLIAWLMLIAPFPSGGPAKRASDDGEGRSKSNREIPKVQLRGIEGQKEQPQDPQQAAMKQKAIAALKNDPKMREQFLNKVAGPIANKLFECSMVP